MHACMEGGELLGWGAPVEGSRSGAMVLLLTEGPLNLACLRSSGSTRTPQSASRRQTVPRTCLTEPAPAAPAAPGEGAEEGDAAAPAVGRFIESVLGDLR